MTDYIEDHAVQIDHAGFMKAVDTLESLIETNVSENELQKHIETYPFILSQQFAHCHHVFPKVALGSQYETDFMCLDIPSSGKEWVGVELESHQKKVITKSGRKTADLEHAIQQIRDWRSWVTDNLSYARQSKEQNGLGLVDIIPRFFGYVIIGRREDFNQKFNELRRQLLRDELITVRSWDGIIEWGRKRAKVFSGISDAFKIIKKQQDLIKQKDKLYKLKTLVAEYKHAKELLAQTNLDLSILEEQYSAELTQIRLKLSDDLIQEIASLLKQGISSTDIVARVKNHIPDDIPSWVLEEYISIHMTYDVKN
jgi:hypothetical protein